MIWAFMALYRSMVGQVRTPERVSDLVFSISGMKQGSPLSPTLFCMYVNEFFDYIDREGIRGA